MEILVLLISALLQISSAIVTLSLVKATVKWYYWVLISFILFFTGIRRLVLFFNFVFMPGNTSFSFGYEITELILSLLLLIGITGIRYALLPRKGSVTGSFSIFKHLYKKGIKDPVFFPA